METLKQTIRDRIIEGKTNRLKRLEEIRAPAVMIENLRNEIAEGKVNVGGEKALLDIVILTWEYKTGRGGKTYFLINGDIQFFPDARYGMFITKAKTAETAKGDIL